MSDNTVFKAISDNTRREILYLLTVTPEGLNFRDIATHFNSSRQGATKHLKILEKAGLIKIESKGRENKCLANPIALKGALEWISFFERYFVERK